jgi:endonuclease/exonuclease/phosphatase family metal-dependent hydrolase
MTFRLLTYNILHGGTGRVDAISRVINACAPDLVLLQEATDAGNVERLGQATGMADCRTFRRQSLGFLSRTPVVSCQWIRPRISRHAFLEVVPEGERLRLFGVHLSAVHAAWTEQRRVMELRALLRSVAQHQAGFHVLAGDFNTVAPGDQLEVNRLPLRLRPLMWMSGGNVRWRTIQTVLDAGYADVFRTLHPSDPGMTLPTSDPHIRLDYVFVPAAEMPRVRSCVVIRSEPARQASDHFPVLTEIDV